MNTFDMIEYYKQFTDQNFNFYEGGAEFKGTEEEFADWRDRERVLQEEQSIRYRMEREKEREEFADWRDRERVLQEEQSIRYRMEREKERERERQRHDEMRGMQAFSQGMQSLGNTFGDMSTYGVGFLSNAGFDRWRGGF